MSRVSVLMAAYNAEKYISKALDSLLSQTHKDLQIICIDDVSTDSTFSILKECMSAVFSGQAPCPAVSNKCWRLVAR